MRRRRTPSQRMFKAAVAAILAVLMLLLGRWHAAHQRPAPPRAISVPQRFSGEVIKVSDGDTLDVLHEGAAVRVRLHGVDAPEMAQPHGREARQAAARLALDRTVTVEVAERDRYGRAVGEVLLPDGRKLGHELVRGGHAWWYRSYSKDKSLGELEAHARKARRGLWAEPNPVPPWTYRRELRDSERN